MKQVWNAIRLMVFLSFFGLLMACSEEKTKEEEQDYTGPLVQAENVQILLSDSAIVRVRINAKKQMEYESGDRQFPEGIYIEFLDVLGDITSTLKADTGFYFQETNLYKASGNVVVKNYNKDEQLNSEELFWDPTKEKVYTDQYVEVKHEGGLLKGKGFKSSQDFSDWEILKPEGTIDTENGKEDF